MPFWSSLNFYFPCVTTEVLTSWEGISSVIVKYKSFKIMKYYTYIHTYMFVNGKQNCFITLKDHKPNFPNNPTVRLLNLEKNELCRNLKINVNLRNSLYLNQWKNTQEVINWFEGIDNKQHYKFIMFDIKDFYPSILKELLTNALTFNYRV